MELIPLTSIIRVTALQLVDAQVLVQVVPPAKRATAILVRAHPCLKKKRRANERPDNANKNTGPSLNPTHVFRRYEWTECAV
jgi:hypothetical protein